MFRYRHDQRLFGPNDQSADCASECSGIGQIIKTEIALPCTGTTAWKWASWASTPEKHGQINHIASIISIIINTVITVARKNRESHIVVCSSARWNIQIIKFVFISILVGRIPFSVSWTFFVIAYLNNRTYDKQANLLESESSTQFDFMQYTTRWEVFVFPSTVTTKVFPSVYSFANKAFLLSHQHSTGWSMILVYSWPFCYQRLPSS